MPDYSEALLEDGGPGILEASERLVVVAYEGSEIHNLDLKSRDFGLESGVVYKGSHGQMTPVAASSLFANSR